MSVPAAAAAAPAAPPAIPAPPTSFPWFGLTAVLMGTFISTLNTRLSTLGLADIRGAVHAGFRRRRVDFHGLDRCPDVGHPGGDLAGCDLWHAPVPDGSLGGIRRHLHPQPFSPNLPTLLVFQFLGGLATGFFIPLTLSFVLRNTPPKAWAYGIAVYALNLEVSLNVSASLEGWYTDHLSWRFIFWQNVPFAIIMVLLFVPGRKAGAGRPPPGRVRIILRFIFGGFGFALIYAALDQGNRLDWLNSPLVIGLHGSRGPAVDRLFRTRMALPLPGG